jgi:hypothetical protein
MCARNSGDDTVPASSRRFMSLQAGWIERNSAGIRVPSSLYQPIPKPSPLVVSAPRRECRLWSISECRGLYNNSSSRIGDPEYAIQRHMDTSSPRPPGRSFLLRG